MYISTITLIFFIIYSIHFIGFTDAHATTSITVAFNSTVLLSCMGAYVLERDYGQGSENEIKKITSNCDWDKDGNLVLIIHPIDELSSGEYTCQDDDTERVFTSFLINISKAFEQQSTSSNDDNKWLFTSGKCSTVKWKDFKNDQSWMRANGEMICNRKTLVESCDKIDKINEKQERVADENKGLQRYLAPIITASMLIFIMIIVIIGFIFVRRKHSEINDLMKLYNELIKPPHKEMAIKADKPLHEQLDNLPFDRSYEIRLHRIIIRKVKSKGRYGRVYMAELRSMQLGKEKMEVNVKGPKEDAKYDDVRSLANEAKVMMAIGLHPNVLGLIGVVIENMPRGGDLYVVVEYTAHNLKAFLHKRKEFFINELISKDETDQNSFRQNRSKREEKKQKTLGPSISTTVLCSFAYQIANGMEFLARKNCVHRDLAARNVLLRENLTIRIADFGEDRQWDYQYLMQEIEYSSPYKIMARESISESQFSEKTDVWSYGVLLWEIFTLGDDPHENIHSPQKLAEYYQHGGRLEKPIFMPDNVSTLMFDCWQEDPVERPSFLNCRSTTLNILRGRNSEFFCWLQNQLHEEYVKMQKYAECRDGPDKDDTVTEIA